MRCAPTTVTWPSYGSRSGSSCTPTGTSFGWQPDIDSWLTSWDAGFSERLADAGFVGLTIPTEYGGHGQGFLHRYVRHRGTARGGRPGAPRTGSPTARSPRRC